MTASTVYLRSATGAAPSDPRTFSALTANGGRFTISGVEPGTYFLVAVKPGFQRASSNSNTPFTVEGDVTVSGKTLTLTPLPNGSVAGLVQDTAGNPITGATVVLTSQDNSVTQRIVTPTNIPASINPKDNYFFQSVPVANYTALATGPLNPNGKQEYQAPAGGATSVAPDAPNDKGFGVASSPTVDGVNFTLTPVLASISGRIYDKTSTDDATGGALTAGAIVTLTDAAGKAVGSPVTAAADGTYSFTNVPATNAGASFTVTAVKAGYTTGTLTIKSVFFGDVLTGQDLGLAPIPAAALHGTVTDIATGAGVGSALVTFTSSDGSVTLKATADPNGNYSIANVPPGTYNGTATGPLNGGTPPHPTYIGGTASNVVVPSGANVTVNFTVTAVPSLSGTVTDHQTGKPVPGAVVTLTDPSGKVLTPVTTGADGVYRFTDLPLSQSAATAYTLTATATGYFDSPPQTVTVGPSDALVVPIALDEKGTVIGLVTDSSTGQPLAGATVTLTDTTTGAAVATIPTPLLTTGATANGPDGKTENYFGTFILTPGHAYAVAATKSNYNPAADGSCDALAADQHRAGPGRPRSSPAASARWAAWSPTRPRHRAARRCDASRSPMPPGQDVVATFTTNGSATAGPDGTTRSTTPDR